jgi:hypothetical protein
MGSVRSFLFLLSGVVGAAFLAVTDAQADPVNHVLPHITGIASPGRTLTATPGTWEITGGVSYAYAWLHCDAAGKACKPLKRSGKQVLGRKLIVPAKITGTLRVSVLASDSSGTAAALSPPVRIRAKA